MRMILTGATGVVGKLLLEQNIEGLQVSAKRRDILMPMMFPQADYIVHAAGLKFGWKSVADPAPYIQANIVGTFNVLEAARAVSPKMFVLISTVEAADPRTPYAASKAAAEALALSYWHSYGLNACIVRLPSVLNYSMQGEGFAAKVLRGDIVTAGDGYKQWVEGGECAKQIYSIMLQGKPGQTYAIGGTWMSDREVMDLCLKS